jgi:hypothetical protein
MHACVNASERACVRACVRACNMHLGFAVSLSTSSSSTRQSCLLELAPTTPRYELGLRAWMGLSGVKMPTTPLGADTCGHFSSSML